MSHTKLKNIEKASTLNLADQVECQPGQVVSKTLVQNDKVSLTLFAFDEGEEISSHASHGDALVTVFSGSVRITLADKEHVLKSGQSIVMPAEVPHALTALEPMKFMLTVIF